MNHSTAQGLAGGGALLTLASLLMPWYVLRVGGLSGLGKSGMEALGVVSVLVIVLGIAAGWSAIARLHPLLPSFAAGGLALLVLIKLVSPPAAGSALAGSSSSAIQSQFANAFTSALGIHYAPAWGLWLAAIGAAATLTGTIAAALQQTNR